jgi:hypothetical protein
MDEVLARGYSKQFLSWLDEDLIKARNEMQKLVENIRPYNHRNNFKKFAEKLNLIYKKLSLNFFLGGSERKPFVAFISYSAKKGKYESWEEKEIIPVVVIFFSDGQGETLGSPFTISEHALKRVFQRSGIIVEKNNHYAITEEMSYIPVWASFWTLFQGITETSELDLEVYIPGIQGLFLIKMQKIKSVSIIHVRTYLGPKDLNEDQIFLRDTLIQATSNLKNSMLSFFPTSQRIYQGQVSIDFDLILHRLKPYIDKLSPLLIRSNDDLEISIFKRKLIETIKKVAQIDWDILDGILNKFGYRVFSNQIHKAVLKKRELN